MKFKSFIWSGYFLIVGSFLVILLFALSEAFSLRAYNTRIEAIYRSSINYSSNYWANQFYIVNSELVSMIDKNDETDYNQICLSEQGEDISEEISNLQRDLTNMSIINNNRFVFFAFIPEKDVMLSSISHIDYVQEKEIRELQAHILSANVKNYAFWNPIKLGSHVYFLHLYTTNGGYGGCYISCEDILEDIMPSESESNASILNMDGTLFYGKRLEDTSDCIVYSRAIRMINKKICVEVPVHTAWNRQPYLYTVLIIAGVAALFLVFIFYLYQQRRTVRPLLRLADAMGSFSEGNVDIRLHEDTVNGEVRKLYRTFNHMAQQIVGLKITAYENEIEKSRLRSQFLKVQIQPHFYTNILNVIYALAEAGDDQTIKKLSKNLAGYFRYLLSIHTDVVPIKDELQCVKWYTEVQKIRYQDHFELQIQCDEACAGEEIPPLLLQTFIENGIRHNIMIVPDLCIRVIIERDSRYIRIQIEDNGVGFSAEVLEKIERNELLEESGQHIGIDNIRGRLAELYGGQAEIRFSNLPVGAVITIVLPRHGE